MIMDWFPPHILFHACNIVGGFCVCFFIVSQSVPASSVFVLVKIDFFFVFFSVFFFIQFYAG